MNILIIEDNKILNNLIKNILEKNNYKVYQATSIKEAMKILKNQHINIVILDLILKDGNGSEILNKVNTENTKSIVISALEDEKLKNILYQKGIVDFIPKSLEKEIFLEELLDSIELLKQSIRGKICFLNKKEDEIFEKIKKIFSKRDFQIIKCSKECTKECDIFFISLENSNKEILKTIENIKKEYPYTPIIGIYKKLNSSDFRIFRKNGVNDFIKYPFLNEELILKVDNWIEYVRNLKKLENRNKDLIKALKREIEKNIQKDKFVRTQARKAQVGDMLAIIAHQLKQPINHISMANYLIKEYISENIKDKIIAKDAANQIDISVDYMSKTIDTFKNFFKPKKRELTTLKEVIDETLLILKPLIETNNIKVEIDVKNDKEKRIFKNDLIQVIINIIKNDIEALIENKVDNPIITIEIDKNKIKIKDNAGGIPKKVLKKIFKPYVSTKGEKGTGLGLYMSKIIMKDIFNGDIKAYNDNEGAVFEITL